MLYSIRATVYRLASAVTAGHLQAVHEAVTSELAEYSRNGRERAVGKGNLID